MNELATTNPKNAVAPRSESAPLPQAVEKALIEGDLSGLSTEHRMMFYRMKCEASGLDYRAQPFLYVRFKGKGDEPGKLTLYATKSATDQLIANRKLRVEITRRGFDADTGCYAAECRVTLPDGQYVEDMGAVPFSWKGGDIFQGEPAGNAMMKAITKAKRRTVLSACGLGMLDESEIDSVPGAVRISHYGDPQPIEPPQPQPEQPKPEPPKNNSGFGRGQYASDAHAEEYKKKMEAFLSERNQRWIDRWVNDRGEVQEGVKDICNLWQADGHLAKWAVETKRLAPESLDENGKIKNRQIGKYTAIVYFRSKEDQKALGLELARYLDQQESRQLDALKQAHPELFEDDCDPDLDIVNDEPSDVMADAPAPAGKPAQTSLLGTSTTGPYGSAT